ncbi:MAG: rod shape-determining protein MreC [Treponema sp.]|nr:rod shape-determining protein MreC [Treponema sp.]MBQ2551569.1 rod shape-determining protein MreC [Treponema sp.]MBQ4235478.1 rod shape-determining protein MreC [Treponema sp.]MBQ5385239.1 rod shape-determining protein MreC [Treponema sp.]
MKTKFFFKLPEVVLIVLILFSGIMLGFSAGGFLINFKSIGFSAISAVQMGAHNVADGVTGAISNVRDLFVMKKEYDELKEKLADYEYLKRNNVDIRKENELLREQLAFATSVDYKNFVAQIIGRDPNSLYSVITVDKGVRDGIKKGMPVIAIQDGNVGVVGRVVTVGVSTSQIMPIYDSKSNISARIETTRELGIISGGGGIDAPLSMSYINKRSKNQLNYGDVVVTSGENGNYMRDVPVATITKINELDYDSSLDIELVPVLDFNRLETVLIVDPSMGNDRMPFETEEQSAPQAAPIIMPEVEVEENDQILLD